MKRLLARMLIGCLVLFSAPVPAQQVTDVEMALYMLFSNRPQRSIERI